MIDRFAWRRTSFRSVTMCWAGCIAFILTAGPSLSDGAEPAGTDERSLLIAASVQIDRIDILPTAPYILIDGSVEKRGPVTLSGREKIAKLLESLEFVRSDEEPSLSYPCLCWGSHKLEFYSGEHYRFGFTYHHWNRLRGGLGAPWRHDAVLTATGEEALVKGLLEHGISDLQVQREAERAWQSTLESRHADFLAKLPPKARSWIPKPNHNQAFGPEVEANRALLFEHYGDKRLLVLTIWRMFGHMFKDSVSEYDWNRGEPRTFLSNCLVTVSDEDFDAALGEAADLEADAIGGVIAHWVFSSGEAQARYERSRAFRTVLDRYVSAGRAERLPFILAKLEESSFPEIDMILAQLAERLAGEIFPENDFEIPPYVDCLRLLASRRVELGRHLVAERMAAVKDETERNALEVIQAAYGGNLALDSRHMAFSQTLHRYAELAWNLINERDQGEPSIELLVAAAKSESYTVSMDAEKRLAQLGLQVLPTLTANPDEGFRIAAGRRALAAGDYRSARGHLMGVDDAYIEYDYALSAFALGRYDEIQFWMSSDYRSSGEKGRAMMLRGCYRFLRRDYHSASRDFIVSSELSDSRNDNADLIALLHFTYLALDRGKESPAYQWEYVKFYEEQEMTPKEGLIALLAGRLPAEELLALVAKIPEDQRPEVLTTAHWILSEMARSNGDTAAEASHRQQALDAGAYASISHILALRRTIEDSWQ